MKYTPLIILGLLAASKLRGGTSTTPGFPKTCITSRFGYRINPVTGKQQFHNGIDLSLAANTPLYAPADSVIVKVWSDARGGNQIIYKLSNGVQIGYAHLNKINVSTNQAVKKGQLLGLSGSTGQVTGAHLHVTVRNAAGQYIDPEPYFKVQQCA